MIDDEPGGEGGGGNNNTSERMHGMIPDGAGNAVIIFA